MLLESTKRERPQHQRKVDRDGDNVLHPILIEADSKQKPLFSSSGGLPTK